MEGNVMIPSPSDPLAWEQPLLTRNGESNFDFFRHLKDEVVLAVAKSEAGHEHLEQLMLSLRTYAVSELCLRYRVCLLSVGYLCFKDGMVEEHHPSIDRDRMNPLLLDSREWCVVALRYEDNPGSYTNLYAVLNVGREGWCVFTARFHTLFHVLKNHRMSAEHLTCREVCREECSQRQHSLLPRLRALLQNPGHYVPNLDINNDTSLLLKRCLEIMSVEQDEFYYYMFLRCPGTLSYLELMSPIGPSCGYYKNSWFLLAGFDIVERKHKAVAGFFTSPQAEVRMMLEERVATKFLLKMRPLLRASAPRLVNRFLSNFTCVNPVSWDEATCIVYESQSLQTLALREVCELQMDYVKQHAPPVLYKAIIYAYMVGREPPLQIPTESD